MSSGVPVSRLRDWIRDSISSQLLQAERERDKLLSEISKALATIPEFCAQLSRKAEQDMETKRQNRAQYRAAKAVGRLASIVTDMCRSITIPPSKESASLRNLQRETSKVASDSAQARQGWLRQIRPYYIIDMMTLGGNIDKLRRLGEELHQFLVGRGTVLRSLEDLDEKLASFSKLQASRDTALSQRHSIEKKLAEAELEEKSLRMKIEEIRQSTKMKEYMQIDSELRALRSELLRTGFSRLGRPLRKLMSMSERGDYPLPVEIRETMKEYIGKPFTTFLKEEDGYPQLKNLMTALSKAVSRGKLALKQREAKKVIERTGQVISQGSLAKIQVKAKELKQVYDAHLGDQETAAMVQKLKDLRKKGRTNQAVQEELKAELKRALETERRYDEQIDQVLKEIDAFSRKISGTAVKVQLG